ncbi:MAG: hypothetical protein R3288_04100 [Woeseiaceae bacterium]|nr:hypothetical protein [Woeseiaceae bacterium]
MDSKVHPLVAMLVIACALLAVGTWMWGSGEAKKIGGPAQLIVAPNGHLFVQMQDKLLEHDARGAFVARHELSDLGVGRLLGGIGVFSDGDLLLRRGDDSRSLLDNLRAWQRRTNRDSIVPESDGAGLYRCELESRTCDRFGNDAIDFKATYHVTIDRQTDDVYVADTTRHVLRKYDAGGDAVAGPVGGFHFPNELMLFDGRLYVADTNHHRVAVLDPGDTNFGDEFDSIDVVPGAAERHGQTWPSYLARVGDEWWVNLMRNGMSDGGVYVFDANWRYVRQVDLPADADPIDIQPFGNVVYISDWNNDAVYRVSRDGFLIGTIESGGFDGLVAESVDARWEFQVYAYLGIGLFLFVLAALLVKGIATPSEQPKRSGPRVAATFSDELIWLQPDPARARKFHTLMRVIGILFAFLFVLTGILSFFSACRPYVAPLVPLIGGMLFVYVLLLWLTRANFRTAIGLKGETITLRDHKGREKTFALGDVLYDGATLAADDMAVFLGQPAAPIYDRQQLMEQLFPRLAFARSVSIWQMQAQLFRVRHAQAVLGMLTLLALVAAATWFMVRHLM